MELFRYSAIDADGKSVSGTLRAPSKDAVIETIQSKNLTPINVEVLSEKNASDKSSESSKLGKSLSFGLGVSAKELMVFTRQLATTLNAGLPLIRIVHIIHRETSSKGLSRILESVGQALQKGKSFSQALEEHPHEFNPMYLNMVRVGERSGSLPECVARLATIMEREMSLRRKIRSAMVYPIFVLIFTCLITWAMMAFLMPKLTPTFEGSGLNIPRDYPLTQKLMELSKFVTSWQNMGLIVGVVIALVLALKISGRTVKGRFIIDYCKINAPFIKGFVLNFVAARFSRNFSLLLQSGIPLVDALNLVANSSGNAEVTRKLNRSAKEIGQGSGITATLRTTGVFPDMLIQMSSMGEEAGSLPDMMERVADYYDEEVDSSTEAMTSLLEPCMMVLIGGIVMIFVMGVLPPILGISSGLQEQM